jgi:DNA-binding LacI/PurR family transcriptional regulator
MKILIMKQWLWEVMMFRYVEIKNQLTAEIAKLNRNDRLPSRLELCKKLDTTRTTIDRAINELVKEGALFSVNGSGTYVAAANEELSVHEGQSWGVVVRDVSEVFFAKVVRGVENVAQGYGINVIVCNTDLDFNKQEQYIKRLLRFGVSGLIIIPILSWDVLENNRFFSQLTAIKVPFVLCNREAEGVKAPIVTLNNFYGGYLAAKHLVEKGYRHIAYIAYQNCRTSIDRCHGYIAALLENGIEINQKIIIIEDQSQILPLDAGYEAMKNFLVSGQQVDAVFCFNDKVAQGVYQAITEVGLAVSDDIGVVGYDNTYICESMIPAITTVSWKELEMGTKAAEVLYKHISGEASSKFELYLFNPDLVVRDSCLGLKKNKKGAE